MKSLQLDKPHAIVTVGIQGSGKTFFAEKFSETFNAPFIEQGKFLESSKDVDAAESLMQLMIKQMIKTGRSVVIELSLSSRVERSELAKTLRAAGYVPLFVWVQVDADTAMNRTYRSSGIGQDEYKANHKRFSAPHSTEHPLVISGKHTFATQAKAVLKKLSAPRTSVSRPIDPRPPTRGQIIVR
ncbi:MAG: AAA family ATPase [Candidatus Saccharimonadales bacterium]